MNEENVLDAKGINVHFRVADGVLHAVRGLDLDVRKSEVVAIVGESGCGKSVSVKSLIKLIPSPPGTISSEKVMFNGSDISKYTYGELERIRGRYVSMIFQNPMTSLNPLFTIGQQIKDVLLHHDETVTKKNADKRVIELLEMVKIPNPERCSRSYPHEFSGGMLQRALIAMSFASPHLKLIIADEPTTALDVTVQAEILQLMRDLKQEKGVSFLFITHDMGVVCEIADRVIVMYGGSKVEEGTIEQIIMSPIHPYTRGLLKIAKLEKNEKGRLSTIEGSIVNLLTFSKGCPFYNRCSLVSEECTKSFPEERERDGQVFFCHNAK